MNPHANNPASSADRFGFVSVEEEEVLTVPTHTSSDRIGHVVEVASDRSKEPTIAQVAAPATGDVALPSEGDTVLVGYKKDRQPQVLGVQYTDGSNVPAFEEGERVIGHSETNSRIRLKPDGSVHVNVDDGPSFELQANGDVVIDGGSTRPVTDVDFTNETVTRASNVYVPSN